MSWRQTERKRNRTHNWISAPRAPSPLSSLSQLGRLPRENVASNFFNVLFMKMRLGHDASFQPEIWVRKSCRLSQANLPHRTTRVRSISDYSQTPDTAGRWILRGRLYAIASTLTVA